MNGHADTESIREREHGKLVCCFDGTGNRKSIQSFRPARSRSILLIIGRIMTKTEYGGDTSDTNIVKLYQKFDRDAPKQFHYYQRKLSLLTASSHAWPLAKLPRLTEDSM